MANAKEALVFHMEGLVDENALLPHPSLLEEILQVPEYKQAMPCLIQIIPPTGSLKRVNISVDASLLNAIDHAAKKAKKNR
ncbi:type II toxin-antitoxin system HicB family antitoxin, partial [Acinetobacter baumannii]